MDFFSGKKKAMRKCITHLFLYISELIDSLAVAAGGDAVAVAAAVSFLQGLDGLCVDHTQKVVLFQGSSLFLLDVRVTSRSVQLDDV